MKSLIVIAAIITIGLTKTGTASYYANKFEGRKTASGERFYNSKMTAASNVFDLGDTVRVINLNNKKEVVVVINDRMGNQHRLIDLSQAAAKQLGFYKEGLAKVKVEKI